MQSIPFPEHVLPILLATLSFPETWPESTP